MNIRTLTLEDVDLKAKTFLINPYPPGFEKLNLKPGKKGEWEVTKFKVTEEEVSMYNLRLIRDGFPQRIVPPGNYTRLTHGNVVIMSDTPAEAHEHVEAFNCATGRVLVNGLGLGFYLSTILRKKSVTSVTVVEKSPEVIALVGKQIKDKRVTIINDDASTWRPRRGHKFDYIWHDIWDEIQDDNLPEMIRMRQHYEPFSMIQGCWSEEYLNDNN